MRHCLLTRKRFIILNWMSKNSLASVVLASASAVRLRVRDRVVMISQQEHFFSLLDMTCG